MVTASDPADGERAISPVFRGFLEVASDRVFPATLCRATVATLTEALEDLVASDGPASTVLAGGGSAGYEERLPPAVGLRRFALAGRDEAPECFLIALTDRFCAALFGRELPDQDDVDEPDRLYATVWTFDPEVVRDLAAVLERAAATVPGDGAETVRSSLASHPPREPAAEVVHRFTNVMFERLEAEQRRWRDTANGLTASADERTERARRQLQLERAAVAKTLASTVTHELNNPLASITMAASVLGVLDDEERRQRMTEIIQQQAHRAGRIAGTLSAFVSDVPPELGTLDLDRWIEALVEDHRRADRPITVTGHVGVPVDTDPDRLHRTLTQLLDNAAAATGDGGIEVHIHVAGGDVVIAVVDHGALIPSDAIGSVFDALGDPVEGPRETGLALAIARSHVESLGGKLEVDTPGATATRFTVRIPLEPSLPSEPRDDGGGQETARSPADGSAGRTGGRALIVDDDAPIRGLLEALLRRGGWEVLGTADRTEALEAVTAGEFDMALIDVRLADEDGEQVLRALASVQPGLADRTAFMTGAPPESGRIADRPVLGKPFTWSDLTQLIAELQADA
jgi:signal transduction histidine kinase/CheY-like chemotaxis protein